MTVKDLYRLITGDIKTHQRTIAAQLNKESSRRRRAVALRVQGVTLREIAARLRPPCSYGAADDLIARTMHVIHKRIAGLPRYYLSGRGNGDVHKLPPPCALCAGAGTVDRGNGTRKPCTCTAGKAEAARRAARRRT